MIQRDADWEVFPTISPAAPELTSASNSAGSSEEEEEEEEEVDIPDPAPRRYTTKSFEMKRLSLNQGAAQGAAVAGAAAMLSRRGGYAQPTQATLIRGVPRQVSGGTCPDA